MKWLIFASTAHHVARCRFQNYSEEWLTKINKRSKCNSQAIRIRQVRRRSDYPQIARVLLCAHRAPLQNPPPLSRVPLCALLCPAYTPVDLQIAASQSDLQTTVEEYFITFSSSSRVVRRVGDFLLAISNGDKYWKWTMERAGDRRLSAPFFSPFRAFLACVVILYRDLISFPLLWLCLPSLAEDFPAVFDRIQVSLAARKSKSSIESSSLYYAAHAYCRTNDQLAVLPDNPTAALYTL